MTTWVLLRGLAREARHWGGFPAALQARLHDGDRVMAIDLPGNGGRWKERSPARIEGMVDAVRAELAAAAAAPPYMVVALSMGAMVALQWAAMAPRELRGCVLVNTSLGRFSPFWQRLRPGAYGGLLRLLADRDVLRREARILALCSNLPRDATALEWRAYALECPVSRSNALRQLLAAARFRAPAEGPRIPALLLASASDRLVDVACSRAISKAWELPLQLHPQAGHDLPLDDPDWLVAQVTAWEQGLCRPAPEARARAR